MREEFTRTALLMGEDKIEKLAACRVAVFGLGGVGGYVAEALVRGGIGAIDLVDGDVVSVTNINRQLYALQSTLGMPKTSAAARRIKDINPDISVNERSIYFSGETLDKFDFSAYDYVVDAIDDVPAKVLLAVSCKRAGVPLISCMGTGNKLNPMGFKVADINQTKVCPLARVMRKKLRENGIEKLKVVYSEEEPSRITPAEGCARVPASASFVPPAAGLLLASQVIKDLIAD